MVAPCRRRVGVDGRPTQVAEWFTAATVWPMLGDRWSRAPGWRNHDRSGATSPSSIGASTPGTDSDGEHPRVRPHLSGDIPPRWCEADVRRLTSAVVEEVAPGAAGTSEAGVDVAEARTASSAAST